MIKRKKADTEDTIQAVNNSKVELNKAQENYYNSTAGLNEQNRLNARYALGYANNMENALNDSGIPKTKIESIVNATQFTFAKDYRVKEWFVRKIDGWNKL